VGALELESLAWPEIRDEIARGRDTIVLCLGAVEQHGHHLPMGTDAIFGDEIGRLVAERLDAFYAPTIRVGCSQHHLAFPGTMSVDERTFAAIVCDIVSGWADHGFKRIVLLPTHGGNFAPLAKAMEQLDEPDGVKLIAISDLTLLIDATLGLGAELGVPAAEGGLHGGEWETSMMLALRPGMVHMDRAQAGYTGDLEAGLPKFFEEGIDSLSEVGVIGDPTRASAVHGRAYVDRIVELAVASIESA
jgi:creatinine amidohydrolase